MASVPTVRVTFIAGPMKGIVAFVNADEFDVKIHDLYVDPKAKKAEKAPVKIKTKAKDIVDVPKVEKDEDAEAEKIAADEAKARAEVVAKADKEVKRKANLAKAQAAAKVKRDAAKSGGGK